MTHATKLDGMASRPDKHVVFTMMMPLFQVSPGAQPTLSILTTLLVEHDTYTWSQTTLVPPTPDPYSDNLNPIPSPFPHSPLVLPLLLSPPQLHALFV